MTRAVLVGGPAGSGKSALGRVLARRLHGALLDQDVLTGPLVAVVARLVAADDDLDDPRLRALVRDARYECLLDAAGSQLRCGTDAVLVAPFTAEAEGAERWEAVAGRLGTAGASGVHLVWLQAPADLLERRLRRRDAPRDRARLADPARLRSWLDEVRPPAVPAVVLDASLGPEALADLVEAALVAG